MIVLLFFIALFVLISLAFATAFVFLARHYWKKLDGTEQQRWTQKAFLKWLAKGLGIPILFWILINAGIFSALPPLLPEIAQKPPGLMRWLSLSRVSITTIPIISSYWAWMTLAWLLGIIYHRTTERREFKNFAASCSLLLAPIFGLVVFYLGWGYAGFIGSLWLMVMVSGTIELAAFHSVPLSYSRAIAALQFDKNDEAEAAIIKELEKCDDDFTGWMMLAEVYATRFNDLKGADKTVRDTCAQSNVNASQINEAFHRLADWYLAYGNDPVSARAALGEICRRFPNTHLDKMARLRMDQLPRSREELIAQRTPKTIHLRVQTNVETGQESPPAESKANRCIEKLKQNPDDVATREELAVIFARDLQRAELGIEQLELLLEMKDQSEKKSAEWLGLIAAWQLRFLDDKSAAQKTFERLLDQFPESPQAVVARNRLESLKNESTQSSQV